jgi:hypothetical protein
VEQDTLSLPLAEVVPMVTNLHSRARDTHTPPMQFHGAPSESLVTRTPLLSRTHLAHSSPLQAGDRAAPPPLCRWAVANAAPTDPKGTKLELLFSLSGWRLLVHTGAGGWPGGRAPRLTPGVRNQGSSGRTETVLS